MLMVSFFVDHLHGRHRDLVRGPPFFALLFYLFLFFFLDLKTELVFSQILVVGECRRPARIFSKLRTGVPLFFTRLCIFVTLTYRIAFLFFLCSSLLEFTNNCFLFIPRRLLTHVLSPIPHVAQRRPGAPLLHSSPPHASPPQELCGHVGINSLLPGNSPPLTFDARLPHAPSRTRDCACHSATSLPIFQVTRFFLFLLLHPEGQWSQVEFAARHSSRLASRCLKTYTRSPGRSEKGTRELRTDQPRTLPKHPPADHNHPQPPPPPLTPTPPPHLGDPYTNSGK